MGGVSHERKVRMYKKAWRTQLLEDPLIINSACGPNYKLYFFILIFNLLDKSSHVENLTSSLSMPKWLFYLMLPLVKVKRLYLDVIDIKNTG